MNQSLWKCAGVSLALLLGSGCAVLHHVQLGEVDGRENGMVPFEVMVSETGVDVQEAGQIASATNTQAGRDANNVAEIIAMFQMGPRTGLPIYNEKYAEKLIYLIHEKCPSGQVTGLTSIREMRKYPVISGEIVKVTGYCIHKKSKT